MLAYNNSALSDSEYKQLILTAIVGLIAAMLVGTGEFLLHFDTLNRYDDAYYSFMLATPDQQQTLGHFFGVFGAPLYIVGCWHIYLMLKPANQHWAFIAFLLGAYGFMIGADWISSRASVGALIHHIADQTVLEPLIQLYQQRYESLLTVIRVTTLGLSIIYIALVITGRSHYQKWQALLNPILLIIFSFVIYFFNAEIGKYMMPIALNIAFFIFFLMSLLQVISIKNKEQ